MQNERENPFRFIINNPTRFFSVRSVHTSEQRPYERFRILSNTTVYVFCNKVIMLVSFKIFSTFIHTPSNGFMFSLVSAFANQIRNYQLLQSLEDLTINQSYLSGVRMPYVLLSPDVFRFTQMDNDSTPATRNSAD